MQMLQSDWLSYLYTMAIRVRWLSVVHEMRRFYRFSELLAESLDVNGSLNS